MAGVPLLVVLVYRPEYLHAWGELAYHAKLTIVLVNRLELDRALENGEEALVTARRANDEVSAARAMDGLKLVAFALGDYPTLRELAAALEDVLRRRDDRWYLQFVLAEGAFAAAAVGDWDDAFRRLDEAQSIAEELDAPYVLTLRAWLERARGHYGEALRLGHGATVAAREGHNTQWMAWTEANLGAILVELGDLHGAIGHLEAGRVFAERGAIRIQLVRLTAHLALARLLTGEQAAAAHALEVAEELLAQMSLPPGKLFLYGLDAYLALARVRLARSEVETAIGHLSPLLTAAHAISWAEGIACAALGLGECSALQGHADAAIDFFEQTLAAAVGAQLAPLEWQAHAALAKLREKYGDIPSAELHRGLARTLVDGLSASITDPPLRQAFMARALARMNGA